MSLLPRVRAGSRGSNDLDTPEEAVRYLLPYLPPPLLSIWEPCPGNHAMTRALEKVSGLDVVETTFDFLSSFILENGYDVIVTNPPFSKKAQFIERCVQIGKPWALLLPVTTLGVRRCQINLKDTEILFPPKRIDFTGKKAPWFAVMWVTQGLQIGRQMTFVD